MSRLIYPKPYKILTICVCGSAAVIGGFFGSIYAIMGILVVGVGGG